MHRPAHCIESDLLTLHAISRSALLISADADDLQANPIPFLTGSSAVARAGLAAYTKLFAESHAAHNVRINNVLPGWIDSLPQTDQRRDSVPMGRYGTSEEIAATISFLLSDGAAYITGQNLRVDGGLMRSV